MVSELRKRLEEIRSELARMYFTTTEDNEKDKASLKKEKAEASVGERLRHFQDVTIARFAGLMERVEETEAGLREKIGKLRRPDFTSGDTQRVLVAQNYDSRAREFIARVEPSQVAAEIRENLNLPDYVHSLIEWSRLRWMDAAGRARLALEFEAAAREADEASGVSQLKAELQELHAFRDELKIHQELAAGGVFQVSLEAASEAERLGVTPLQFERLKLERENRRKALEAERVTVVS